MKLKDKCFTLLLNRTSCQFVKNKKIFKKLNENVHRIKQKPLSIVTSLNKWLKRHTKYNK